MRSGSFSGNPHQAFGCQKTPGEAIVCVQVDQIDRMLEAPPQSGQDAEEALLWAAANRQIQVGEIIDLAARQRPEEVDLGASELLEDRQRTLEIPTIALRHDVAAVAVGHGHLPTSDRTLSRNLGSGARRLSQGFLQQRLGLRFERAAMTLRPASQPGRGIGGEMNSDGRHTEILPQALY